MHEYEFKYVEMYVEVCFSRIFESIVQVALHLCVYLSLLLGKQQLQEYTVYICTIQAFPLRRRENKKKHFKIVTTVVLFFR